MGSWSMVVAADPGEVAVLAAARVDDAGIRLLDVPTPTAGVEPGVEPGVDARVDDAVAVLSALAALAAEEAGGPGGPAEVPARLWIVTPADAERRRFEDLAEAAALAGLPAPTWLPTPVALAGDRLARDAAPGGRGVVLDARGDDLVAWPVERTADGVEIGAGGPVGVVARLDQLLVGVVRAKLQLVAPAFAARVDEGTAPTARRDAAALRRALRHSRRTLCTTGVETSTVAVDGVEVVVEREVFAQLVVHALGEAMNDLGTAPGDAVELVADASTPLVRDLARLTGAEVRIVGGDPDEGVLGAAALVPPVPGPVAPRPRPVSGAGESVTGPLPSPADETGQRTDPGPRAVDGPRAATLTRARRPRWAVPALSALLLLAVTGSAGVLVLGPQPLEWTSLPATSVPAPGR